MSELPSIEEIARIRWEHRDEHGYCATCITWEHPDREFVNLEYPCDTAKVLRVLDALFADRIAELEARVAENESHTMTIEQFWESQ